MKYSALSFFIFFFCCAVSAQNYLVAKVDSVNYIDANGLRQGYCIIYGSDQKNASYRPDGKVEEGNFIDSKKTGKWISYWPNGEKKYEAVYINGSRNGKVITYYENGHKKEEGIYRINQWIGEYKMLRHRYIAAAFLF
jgi:antitoxin component YwqK of YwqJK toxin-antitoxin module